MTETKTILSLAEELQAQLTTITRDDKSKAVVFKDGAPDWMSDFADAVHGNKFPDDDTYRFIEKAIDAIADSDADNADAAREAIDEIESDIYTRDLMDWVAGNYEYCEQAMQEGLWSSEGHDFVSLLSIGQAIHIREVGYAVVNELEELANQSD